MKNFSRYAFALNSLIIALTAVMIIALTACDNGTNVYLSVPLGVNASATSSNSITLSWSSVSNADGYKVYSSTSPSGTYFLSDSTSSISYTHTGLNGSTTYYYKVSAYNSGGESSLSSVVSATTFVPTPPSTPTGVNALATDGYNGSVNITLSWSSVSNADGYNVYISSSPGENGFLLGTSSTTSYTSTWPKSSPAASGSSYFSVSAYNSIGESPVSLPVSVSTSPVTPSTPSYTISGTYTLTEPRGATYSYTFNSSNGITGTCTYHQLGVLYMRGSFSVSGNSVSITWTYNNLSNDTGNWGESLTIVNSNTLRGGWSYGGGSYAEFTK